MPLAEPAGVYRPRHPERTVVYRLFEEHFERYVREYEERYEAREGSLRKVVSTAVEAYLACGRPEGGFARIRCPNCRAAYIVVTKHGEAAVLYRRSPFARSKLWRRRVGPAQLSDCK